MPVQSLDSGTTIIEVPFNKLVEAPDNVRTEYDQAEIEELAESIAQHGLLSPPTVFGGEEISGDGTYAVIYGHRRFRALQWLKQQKRIKATEPIRCILDNDAQHGGLPSAVGVARMLIENLQRTDLSPIDEARGYRRMTEEHGYTQRDLAATVGKSAGHVAKRLSLLLLPPDLQAMVGHKLDIDDAYRLSRLDPSVIERLAKNLRGGGSGVSLKYDLESAERAQKRAEDEVKFAKALAKAMIDVNGDEDEVGRDRVHHEFIGNFDHTTLDQYEPKKNHVVCWSFGAKTGIRVFRKLTAKQAEQAQERKLAEMAKAEAEVEAEEKEWLESEATPHERWEYETAGLDEAYRDQLVDWQEQVAAAYGQILKDTAPKELSKLIIGTILADPYDQPHRVCKVLGLHPPLTGPNGEDLSHWQRPWGATVDEWMGDDNGRRLMVWLAESTSADHLLHNPAFRSINDSLAEQGIVAPEKPVHPPEPWWDVTTDTWRIDAPEARELYDGTVEPQQDDFDDPEEFAAASQVFNEAWQAEQDNARAHAS